MAECILLSTFFITVNGVDILIRLTFFALRTIFLRYNFIPRSNAGLPPSPFTAPTFVQAPSLREGYKVSSHSCSFLVASVAIVAVTTFLREKEEAETGTQTNDPSELILEANINP